MKSIIQQTMAIASSLGDPRKQKYFVLLIITGAHIVFKWSSDACAYLS
jgi:hypothetical protein